MAAKLAGIPMPTVGLVLYPRFAAMSFAAMTAFEMVNLRKGRSHYEVRMVSQSGGTVPSSLGAEVSTIPLAASELDTVIVAGADRLQEYDKGLVALLREKAKGGIRTAAMCTGTFALAEAGLLDGRRATTHWHYASEFRARYPKVRTDEDKIFINDGQFWTSAGMSAGTDMAIAMIDHDLGSELAKEVARLLVVQSRRSGGQLQFSALLDLDPKSDRIQNSLNHARANLGSALSVEDLARVANLSTRQFSRAFREETGQSPAKAIERMRAEAARQMIEEGRHPVEYIARETGFADRDRMRKAFVNLFGQSPQAVRRSSRSQRS
jgi:transcriptional regulator GlxA family with amidase domain